MMQRNPEFNHWLRPHQTGMGVDVRWFSGAWNLDVGAL